MGIKASSGRSSTISSLICYEEDEEPDEKGFLLDGKIEWDNSLDWFGLFFVYWLF